MGSLIIFLFNKFLEDTAFVLRFTLVHLADELPDFAAQALRLDGLESLIEALTYPDVTQMFDL